MEQAICQMLRSSVNAHIWAVKGLATVEIGRKRMVLTGWDPGVANYT
jgi:hypothetical protein